MLVVVCELSVTRRAQALINCSRQPVAERKVGGMVSAETGAGNTRVSFNLCRDTVSMK
jgi:hypothetical protein